MKKLLVTVAVVLLLGLCILYYRSNATVSDNGCGDEISCEMERNMDAHIRESPTYAPVQLNYAQIELANKESKIIYMGIANKLNEGINFSITGLGSPPALCKPLSIGNCSSISVQAMPSILVNAGKIMIFPIKIAVVNETQLDTFQIDFKVHGCETQCINETVTLYLRVT